MKVWYKMVYYKVKVNLHFQKVIIKVILKMVNMMVKVKLYGMMVEYILVILRMVYLMDKEIINGQIKIKNLLVYIKMVKDMVKVNYI